MLILWIKQALRMVCDFGIEIYKIKALNHSYKHAIFGKWLKIKKE